jgi:hypothetical protein
MDAKYDELHNHEFVRKQGAIALIDCNPGNERLACEVFPARGYDRNGWAFCLILQLSHASQWIG